MKKRIIIATIIIAATLANVALGFSELQRLQKEIKRQKIGSVKEYWCNQLTWEILENRGDDIIIERIIGKCIDRKGNGVILNPADPDYNYISYRCAKGVRKGDTVMTICIYTPNGAADDICERFDYIIDRTE